MLWKLILWGAISFGIGKGLNVLFQPVEVLYSVSIFSIPFVVLGFQEHYSLSENKWSIFGISIFGTGQTGLTVRRSLREELWGMWERRGGAW